FSRDWSSDVCSSDLPGRVQDLDRSQHPGDRARGAGQADRRRPAHRPRGREGAEARGPQPDAVQRRCRRPDGLPPAFPHRAALGRPPDEGPRPRAHGRRRTTESPGAAHRSRAGLTAYSGPLKMKKAPPATRAKPIRWFTVSFSPRYVTEKIAKTSSVITSCMVFNSAAE